MRVSPINYSNINFKSINNLVKKERYVDYHEHPVLSNPNVNFFSNYTSFFREDIASNWKKFIDIVDEHFEDAKKVNVYCFGCSDGSESYSLAMGLFDRKGEKRTSKFFPIKAYDIDAEMIKKAKKGCIPCSENDKVRINSNLSLSSWYCGIVDVPNDKEYPHRFLPKEKIKNMIDFQTGDFIAKLDEIEPCNTLLMCRNFWYYLGIDRIPEIVSKLAEKLDETSLLVIGDFDRTYVLKELKNAGFEEITMNVLKKTK